MGSIRQGIPHLYSEPSKSGKRYDLTRKDILNLIDDKGIIYLDNVTEKTDGYTFMIGWDEEGVWSRNSGSSSLKMRDGEDYIDRSKQRGTSQKAAEAFSEFHNSLFNRRGLFYQLMGDLKPIAIRGEMFNWLLANKVDEYHYKSVHTTYDWRNFGTLGAFIVHTQLEENKNLDFNLFTSASNQSIKVDTDKSVYESSYLYAGDLLEEIDNEDLSTIKYKLYNLVKESIDFMRLKPKWGPETEGWVFHPSDANPTAPRFKVVSDSFKESKINGWQR